MQANVLDALTNKTNKKTIILLKQLKDESLINWLKTNLTDKTIIPFHKKQVCCA